MKIYNLTNYYASQKIWFFYEVGERVENMREEGRPDWWDLWEREYCITKHTLAYDVSRVAKFQLCSENSS